MRISIWHIGILSLGLEAVYSPAGGGEQESSSSSSSSRFRLRVGNWVGFSCIAGFGVWLVDGLIRIVM